ncbi:tripartite tricarboxylate transporter permease [Sporolituus thermophilus]|uniref:Putative tricarboxylic transport membrane protein n=1 Tax=Sporolituus thermophilus DSM 23256 TaxID=1123285 RepID=A0A1G7JVG9_9FIRM|nr:tripartite tricarboxylate transporter permease [Sporolituus thermophilus]SDF28923.1 putative tricarboxylic transport membrane protein [Sporolituus thermophilus DSM 23256]
MDILQHLITGLSIAVNPMNLLFCFIGVVAGVLIGALPGLGPSAGLAILLPITFGFPDPVAGIILLAGIYYGAMYGGSITSVLLGVPGDPASVMTVADGYPLAQQGRGGPALGICAIGSFIGGTICVLAFTILGPMLAKVALSFGPPEYFALMVLGLTLVAGFTEKSAIKAYLSALVGLFISVIGLDLVTGLPRFTFGQLKLYEGIDFIVVALGLYGITEILIAMEDDQLSFKFDKKQLHWRNLLPSAMDWALSKWHILRSTFLGFTLGMLPGSGATICTFISYAVAKNAAPPERKALFGKGAIEGVAAPETANNAASVAAFVPLLTLGVPGSASTAVLMGALLMFGLQPGPLLWEKNPDFIWGLIGSMYIGNAMLLVLSTICIPFFVRMLEVPFPILNAAVMVFILVGAYSLGNSMFDVGLTLFFGLLGYAMKKMDYPAPPMILALVLGNTLENSLRQTLILSQGSMGIIFTRPVSAVLMTAALASIAWIVFKSIRGYNKGQQNIAS